MVTLYGLVEKQKYWQFEYHLYLFLWELATLFYSLQMYDLLTDCLIVALKAYNPVAHTFVV